MATQNNNFVRKIYDYICKYINKYLKTWMALIVIIYYILLVATLIGIKNDLSDIASLILPVVFYTFINIIIRNNNSTTKIKKRENDINDCHLLSTAITLIPVMYLDHTGFDFPVWSLILTVAVIWVLYLIIWATVNYNSKKRMKNSHWSKYYLKKRNIKTPILLYKGTYNSGTRKGKQNKTGKKKLVISFVVILMICVYLFTNKR